MAWYTVDMIKKVFVFDVKPNTWINVENYTNGNKIKNPSIIYQFKKCVAKNLFWNGVITMEGSYPNYRFNVDSNSINVDKSLISVLIMTGDA